MTDIDKINLIRDAIPVAQNKVYLNAGVIGPLTTIAHGILKEANSQELIESRSGMSVYKLKKQTLADLRQAFANLLKTTPEEITLTHHTTDGMNIVSHGLRVISSGVVMERHIERKAKKPLLSSRLVTPMAFGGGHAPGVRFWSRGSARLWSVESVWTNRPLM